MASQSVYVYDTLEALTQGTIPGEFSGTIFNFPTITSTNSHGKKMLWTISVYLLNSDNKKVKVKDSYLKQPVSQLDGFTGVISVDSRLEGRPSRAAVETFITTGKNIGKKNATNVITQAFRDALGKYTNKLKTASADTVEDQNKGALDYSNHAQSDENFAIFGKMLKQAKRELDASKKPQEYVPPAAPSNQTTPNQ